MQLTTRILQTMRSVRYAWIDREALYNAVDRGDRDAFHNAIQQLIEEEKIRCWFTEKVVKYKLLEEKQPKARREQQFDAQEFFALHKLKKNGPIKADNTEELARKLYLFDYSLESTAEVLATAERSGRITKADGCYVTTVDLKPSV